MIRWLIYCTKDCTILWMIHCHCFPENLRQNKVGKITTNYLPALNEEKVSDKLRDIETIKNQTLKGIGKSLL